MHDFFQKYTGPTNKKEINKKKKVKIAAHCFIWAASAWICSIFAYFCLKMSYFGWKRAILALKRPVLACFHAKSVILTADFRKSMILRIVAFSLKTRELLALTSILLVSIFYDKTRLYKARSCWSRYYLQQRYKALMCSKLLVTSIISMPSSIHSTKINYSVIKH